MYFSDQPILQDFDQFIYHLEANAPLLLTKSMGRLRGADLLALNEKMLGLVDVTKNRPAQKDFILLNTFYYLAFAAELFNVQQEKKGPILNIQPERIQQYRSLNQDERYGFLLQAFWCYMSWDMAFERGLPLEMSHLLRLIEGNDSEQTSTFQMSERPLMAGRFLSELLRAFGLIEYTIKADANPYSNYYIGITALTLTDLGQKILPALLKHRPIYQWGNLDPYLTKARYERIYGPIQTDEENPPELTDFFAVFQSTLPNLAIINRLFPISQEAVSGELTLKILLARNCYRVIRMSAKATFEDLHLAIQEVFSFDNDHLYAFFLSGSTQYQAGNVIADPRGVIEQGEYPAHVVALGEINIFPGKEWLYLFDFGDNWHFLIQVVAIDPSTKINGSNSTFDLLEKKGKAPEQYPDWEE